MIRFATQAELKELRDRLANRWLQLRADLHADERTQQELGDIGTSEVSDRKDEAAQHTRSALEGAQEQRDVNEMAQVEAALHRLEDGTFGACTDCGERIPLARLHVQPAAQRCAPCEAIFERALNRFGPGRK